MSIFYTFKCQIYIIYFNYYSNNSKIELVVEMKIFSDIWSLLMALRLVDIIFFFSVLILMVLVVTLIYFIKINNVEEPKKDLEETQEMKIAKELRDSMKNNDATIKFTDYEKDQEDKAIISYDELVNKGANYELNYETEEMHDDLSVKKVDLDNLVNKSNSTASNIEVRVISFQKEEAFLEALKRLQKELG